MRHKFNLPYVNFDAVRCLGMNYERDLVNEGEEFFNFFHISAKNDLHSSIF